MKVVKIFQIIRCSKGFKIITKCFNTETKQRLICLRLSRRWLRYRLSVYYNMCSHCFRHSFRVGAVRYEWQEKLTRFLSFLMNYDIFPGFIGYLALAKFQHALLTCFFFFALILMIFYHFAPAWNPEGRTKDNYGGGGEVGRHNTCVKMSEKKFCT